MVIGEITVEGPLEMALVEGNDMIQAFPTDATDNALGIRVLPRALRCDGAFFHSQTVNPFSKVISVDGIAITQQILRRRSWHTQGRELASADPMAGA